MRHEDAYQDNNGKRPRIWLRMSIALLLGPALLMGATLIYSYRFQVIEYEKMSREARAQHLTRPTVTGKRGDIYDRNRVPLALTVEQDSIYARPRLIRDKEGTASILAEHLDLSREWVASRLDSSAPFVWIQRQVPPERSRKILGMNLTGIGAEQEQSRFYPFNTLAGQILGFVDIDNRGLEGLEAAFNRNLRGEVRQLELLRDRMGRRLHASEDTSSLPLEGNRLILTLDSAIQSVAEIELEKMVKQSRARGGKVVVMDPRNGDLLALAHYPKFDPSGTDRSPSASRNRIVSDLFEPGSIFKPLTMAAAIEENLVDLETQFDCEQGRFRIGGHTIRDVRPHGKLTVQEVLMVSSNIGTIKVAQLLGREKFHNHLARLGFNRRPNSDMPGEVAGILHPHDRWPEVTLATISFGQGIATSTLHMTMATAAIANGGRMVRPRIVAEIRDEDDNLVVEYPPEELEPIFSKRTMELVTSAMVASVHKEKGTGHRARIPGYLVAGKTGTAQQVDPVQRGYGDIWVGSFVGFAPAENPRVVALVAIDEPEPPRFGGVVAAPVFSRVVEFALKQLEVGEPEPSRALYPRVAATYIPGPEGVAMTGGEGGRTSLVRDLHEAQTRGVAPAAYMSGDETGTGRTTDPGGRSRGAASTSISATGHHRERPPGARALDGIVRIPDFRGLSIRASLELASDRGLSLVPVGMGIAQSQSPAPYSPIEKGSAPLVTVQFSPEGAEP